MPAFRTTQPAYVENESHQSMAPLQREPTEPTHQFRQIGYGWRLREVMNAYGMSAATQLLPPLAARGIRISAVAAWRIVTQPPTRLSLPMLAALCDIFDCSPADLIPTYARDVRPPSGKRR